MPRDTEQQGQQNGDTQNAARGEPAGKVIEVVGNVSVTHADGTTQAVTKGMAIFKGDTIVTDETGAVNIMFSDNSSFAVSRNAELSVDDYIYNAGTEDSSSFFSLLKGVFVYTSGLIGKEDPSDVNIDTSVGSIGIRGTVIAGSIDPDGVSSITSVDGAGTLSNATGTFLIDDKNETLQLDGYESQATYSVMTDEQVQDTYQDPLQGLADPTFQLINEQQSTTQDGQTDGTTGDGAQTAPADDGATTDTQTAPGDGTTGGDGATTDDGATLDDGTEDILVPEALPETQDGTDSGFNDGGVTDPFGSTTTTTAATGGTTTTTATGGGTADGTTTTTSGGTTGGTGGGGIAGTTTPDAPQFTAPTLGQLPVFEFSEPGTFVVDLEAFDAQGETFTFSILSGDPAGAFNLDPNTGVLTVADTLQFNYSINMDFNLTFQVIDVAGNASTVNASIGVADSLGGLSGTRIVGTAGNDSGALGGADLIGNQDAADVFGAISGDDVMQGLGGFDVFYGGLGNDTMQVGDLNFIKVDGHTGNDTLLLGDGLHAALNLDLASGLFVNRIFDIETLDLGGNLADASQVRLRPQDVVNMTDAGNTLTITNSSSVSVANVDLLAGTGFELADLTGGTLGAGNGVVTFFDAGTGATLIIDQGTTGNQINVVV